MKSKLLILICLPALLLGSCIKSEPLNREADILHFSLPEDIQLGIILNEEQSEILVTVHNTDGKNIRPEIKVTEGATVSPASGEAVDFSQGPLYYTVTSQDGEIYQRKYKVSITRPLTNGLKYAFDEWGLSGALWKFPSLNDISWTSANQGIMMAFLGKVSSYPTRSTEDCVAGGYAALLETKEGKSDIWGKNIPVFSGSLFTGSFSLTDAMNDPLLSTHFGQMLYKETGKPVVFKGYYKYTPGETMIGVDGAIPNRVDECSIRSVIYKVGKGNGSSEHLNGYDVETSSKVIAKAILTDGSAKENFVQFSIPYVYTEEPDYENYDYKLAILFASSKNGDSYEGAVGSALIVDEVEIVCEEY